MPENEDPQGVNPLDRQKLFAAAAGRSALGRSQISGGSGGPDAPALEELEIGPESEMELADPGTFMDVSALVKSRFSHGTAKLMPLAAVALGAASFLFPAAVGLALVGGATLLPIAVAAAVAFALFGGGLLLMGASIGLLAKIQSKIERGVFKNARVNGRPLTAHEILTHGHESREVMFTFGGVAAILGMVIGGALLGPPGLFIGFAAGLGAGFASYGVSLAMKRYAPNFFSYDAQVVPLVAAAAAVSLAILVLALTPAAPLALIAVVLTTAAVVTAGAAFLITKALPPLPKSFLGLGKITRGDSESTLSLPPEKTNALQKRASSEIKVLTSVGATMTAGLTGAAGMVIGMSIGTAVAGPLGTVVGAGIGLLIGAVGGLIGGGILSAAIASRRIRNATLKIRESEEFQQLENSLGHVNDVAMAVNENAAVIQFINGSDLTTDGPLSDEDKADLQHILEEHDLDNMDEILASKEITLSEFKEALQQQLNDKPMTEEQRERIKEQLSTAEQAEMLKWLEENPEASINDVKDELQHKQHMMLDESIKHTGHRISLSLAFGALGIAAGAIIGGLVAATVVGVLAAAVLTAVFPALAITVGAVGILTGVIVGAGLGAAASRIPAVTRGIKKLFTKIFGKNKEENTSEQEQQPEQQVADNDLSEEQVPVLETNQMSQSLADNQVQSQTTVPVQNNPQAQSSSNANTVSTHNPQDWDGSELIGIIPPPPPSEPQSLQEENDKTHDQPEDSMEDQDSQNEAHKDDDQEGDGEVHQDDDAEGEGEGQHEDMVQDKEIVIEPPRHSGPGGH